MGNLIDTPYVLSGKPLGNYTGNGHGTLRFTGPEPSKSEEHVLTFYPDKIAYHTYGKEKPTDEVAMKLMGPYQVFPKSQVKASKQLDQLFEKRTFSRPFSLQGQSEAARQRENEAILSEMKQNKPSQPSSLSRLTTYAASWLKPNNTIKLPDSPTAPQYIS